MIHLQFQSIVHTSVSACVHAWSEDNQDCSVCKEEFNISEEVLILPCEHFFHRECIKQWLLVNGTCPIWWVWSEVDCLRKPPLMRCLFFFWTVDLQWRIQQYQWLPRQQLYRWIRRKQTRMSQIQTPPIMFRAQVTQAVWMALGHLLYQVYFGGPRPVHSQGERRRTVEIVIKMTRITIWTPWTEN